VRAVFLVPPPLPGQRPAERVFGCTFELYPFPPLPLLYAAAAARAAGHRAEAWDSPRRPHGLDWGFFEKALADLADPEQQPGPAGAFVLHTVNLSRESDLAAGRAIREACGPDAAVIYTGPGPSWEPERYLSDARTFVLRGEVEESLPELLGELAAGRTPAAAAFPGLTALGPGGPVSGPPRPAIADLDALPLPARDLVDRGAYYNPKLGARPFTAVLSSRGCPHRCRYCVPNALSFARELEGRRGSAEGRKPPVRLRSAAGVVAELEALARDGYRAVSFIDDEFVWSAERTEEICAALGRLGLRWGCLARPDYVDERVAAALERARCGYVDLGVESFVQEILDDVGKDLTVAVAEEAVRRLKRHGVPVKLNVLIGASSLETRQTVEATVRRVIALDPDVAMFGVCSPFPGTPYWDLAVREGLLAEPGGGYRPTDVQREATVRLPHLSPQELVRAVRSANRRFYLRPRALARNLLKARSLGDLLRGAAAFWRKMRP
jgi:radical SAM superfamily enzyme YgiQ (UPF0313 family)